ncbi:hypothetical protein LshimejAT787_1400800 [Lyophyllum shimeji]|uniref:Uncharacterized protein n=1 Tax=Lyophyllum shimeji TaxID=47721 RepID=A0A9P3USF4_LYOSH|nr:hypothetical protein LshimejAT787_1400800 [Lyophyllum shimeji]
MARPRPLANIASARASPSSHQVLTPRTPHSRSGRAEEGYTEVELEQVTEDDNEYGGRAQHQSVPLLSSSASDSFPRSPGYRSRGDDHDPTHGWHKSAKGQGQLQLNTVLSRLPLVLGSITAAFLLFLAFLSYTRPEKLHRYLGILQSNETDSTTPASSHHNTSAKLASHLVISYENHTQFPLRPAEYLAECRKLSHGYMSHGNYWEPHAMGVLDVVHPDDADDDGVCASTITYMLGGEVGLLADLALLAQAAALARERNRTFLIDDTYWNRGKWTDHFLNVRDTQPGPQPGCKAPRPEELVACPRLARHWVINSRTAKFHFGHAYSEAYDDPYAHNLNRLRPQFKFSEESFLHTIRPNKQNSALIQRARSELTSVTSPDGSGFDSYVAVHLRRGDREPAFYRGKYVPAADFVQAATEVWSELNLDKTPESLSIYVASDSVAALREVEDLTATRYTTFSLFQSADAELRGLASPAEYVQKEFDELQESARIRATRGMIVDFALLSGMWASEEDVLPEATICTFSSNVCKLAAVGLGWDAAFGTVDSMGSMDKKHKRWVELDQRGSIVPAWVPFELF